MAGNGFVRVPGAIPDVAGEKVTQEYVNGAGLVSAKPYTAHFRSTAVLDGGTLAVFTASPSLTAANIAGIDAANMPSDVYQAAFTGTKAAITADAVSNILGWAVTLSAGGIAVAKSRLETFLDSDATQQMVWASGSAFTYPTDELHTFFVPADGEAVEFKSINNDITDLYFVPVGSAAVADGVGVMSISLGERL